MPSASAAARASGIRSVDSSASRNEKRTSPNSFRISRSHAGPASDAKPFGERDNLPAKRFERELVKGWLHEPATPTGDGIAITHGAGGDCESPLLKTAADAFASAGLWVLRFDLPFRQQRPHGSPYPAQAARDREGIQAAAKELRTIASGRLFLAGHSYGGRQTP